MTLRAAEGAVLAIFLVVILAGELNGTGFRPNLVDRGLFQPSADRLERPAVVHLLEQQLAAGPATLISQ